MSRFLPSFGRLDVAKHCVFPWGGGLKWPKRPDTDFSQFGQAVSQAAECIAVWGDAPTAAIAEHHQLDAGDARSLATAVGLLRELLNEEALTDHWRWAETPIAYDALSGEARVPYQAHARDFHDQRGAELSASKPDLVRCRADGVLVVRDYKTGRYKWGARPGWTPQLRALGLAFARLLGVDHVVVEIVQVDDDGLRIVSDPLGPFDLAVVAVELREIYERIEGGHEPPRPGYWCRGGYCPLLANCPATERTMAEVAKAAEPKFPINATITSAEHAAYTLERIAAAELAVKTIRHAVEEYARKHGPIALANGKRWGAVQCDGKESIDLSVPGAVEAVEEHLGAFVAAAAVERRTSKSALEDAARAAQSKRGEGMAKVSDLYDRLRELGSLKRGQPYEKFTEFTPRETAARGDEP